MFETLRRKGMQDPFFQSSSRLCSASRRRAYSMFIARPVDNIAEERRKQSRRRGNRGRAIRARSSRENRRGSGGAGAVGSARRSKTKSDRSIRRDLVGASERECECASSSERIRGGCKKK